MKPYLFIILSFVPLVVVGQPFLRLDYNLPRSGDRIVKQQVEYRDPGRSGAGVVWDFGQLKAVNDEYRLSYSAPRRHFRLGNYILGCDTFAVSDGLFVGREHFTNYFYRVTDSVLYLLGYENRLDRMHHKTPLPAVKFPFHFGEKAETASASENLFSSLVPMHTHGEYTLEADATGMIVLPSGDTLRDVLRTRSFHHQYADSVRAMDSIYVDTAIETHRFWARGYRYPVFETVKTIHRYPVNFSGTDTVNVERVSGHPEMLSDTFTTAFFFPPPQQYSDNPDTANLAELERMAAEALSTSEAEGSAGDAWAGMYYNVTPNPARDNVFFEIFLPRRASSLQLKVSNQLGLPMISQDRGAFPAGISNFTLNIGSLPLGNYILDFWLDGSLVHGGVIMKR